MQMDTESGFILPGCMRTNVGFGTCAAFRCTKIVFLALTFHMCSVFALAYFQSFSWNYVKQSGKNGFIFLLENFPRRNAVQVPNLFLYLHKQQVIGEST
jgi:hypothetical protein